MLIVKSKFDPSNKILTDGNGNGCYLGGLK